MSKDDWMKAFTSDPARVEMTGDEMERFAELFAIFADDYRDSMADARDRDPDIPDDPILNQKMFPSKIDEKLSFERLLDEAARDERTGPSAPSHPDIER